jgi:hypothetical protein
VPESGTHQKGIGGGRGQQISGLVDTLAQLLWTHCNSPWLELMPAACAVVSPIDQRAPRTGTIKRTFLSFAIVAQSAGTRTIVISLMASPRLVAKGYSEAFFRS